MKKIGLVFVLVAILAIVLMILPEDDQIAVNKMYFPEYKYPVLQVYIPFRAMDRSDEEIKAEVDSLINEWLEVGLLYEVDRQLENQSYLDSQGNKTEYYLLKPR